MHPHPFLGGQPAGRGGGRGVDFPDSDWLEQVNNGQTMDPSAREKICAIFLRHFYASALSKVLRSRASIWQLAISEIARLKARVPNCL